MEQGYVKLQENMSTKEDDTRKFLMEFKARASQKGGLYSAS